VERDLNRRFYFNNREDWESAVRKDRFSDRNLKVEVVENGIVLPSRPKTPRGFEGGICDKNFNFVAGYARDCKGVGDFWGSLIGSYSVDKEELTYLDEDVIFGGALMPHFGHFMMESLGRLWYVFNAPPPACA